MFDFLVMAQREHKRLGITLTDSEQKQPVKQENGRHCEKDPPT